VEVWDLVRSAFHSQVQQMSQLAASVSFPMMAVGLIMSGANTVESREMRAIGEAPRMERCKVLEKYTVCLA
jgi:hypothetical protein